MQSAPFLPMNQNTVKVLYIANSLEENLYLSIHRHSHHIPFKPKFTPHYPSHQSLPLSFIKYLGKI